jgi:NADP-dependent 3-hydroxy acid dehydrogenase YdfG
MQNISQEKVALITGASRGIGKAIAQNLARQQINLSLLASKEQHVENVKNSCEQLGVNAQVIGCDLFSQKDLKSVIDNVISHYGRLDFLINNAGIYDGENTINADLKVWDAVIDVNLRSLIHLTKHALPFLKKSVPSAVVNIASISGKQTHAGGGIYCASKFGVLGFSGCLFDEVRDYGIKVCAICPGYVNTDMVANADIDPDKAIQPDDIAQAVSFVINFPGTSCPTEILIRPQKSPRV